MLKFVNKEVVPSPSEGLLTRRRFNTLLGANAAATVGVSVTLPSYAQAQSGPITIVVPTLVGGVNDQIARALAFGLTPELKRPVLVENLLGDVGLRALAAAEDSSLENQTLLFANDLFTNLYPATLKKHAGNPIARLTPVSIFSDYAFALAVSADSKIDGLASYLSIVNDNPSKAAYGVLANGTYNHFYASLLGAAAKTKLQTAILRTTKAVLDAIVKGETTATVMEIGSLLEYQRAGKIKLLGVSSEKRIAQFGNVPTFAESGFPELSLQGFHGLYANPKVTSEFQDTMRTALKKVVQTPLVQDLFTQFALAPASPLESFDESRLRIGLQAKRWQAYVKATGFEAI